MQYVKLGDICDILNGYSFESEKYTSNGIRIMRITNVQNGYIEDSHPCFYPIDFELPKHFLLQEDDILISLTGNVGRVGRLPKSMMPAALNQRVACIRIKKDSTVIDKDFLFTFLNNHFFEQLCILNSKGAAQKNMSTEWLKTVLIPVYAKAEQIRISKLIGCLNSIIEEKNELINYYDELVKSKLVTTVLRDYYIELKNVLNNKFFNAKEDN